MSVLARKRKLSELKFYDNAIRLRRSMIYLLMRDLGAKRGGAHQVGAVSAEGVVWLYHKEW